MKRIRRVWSRREVKSLNRLWAVAEGSIAESRDESSKFDPLGDFQRFGAAGQVMRVFHRAAPIIAEYTLQVIS